MIPEKRLFQAVVILALLAAGLIVLGAQLPAWRSSALLLWSLLAALLLVTAAVDAWRAWRQPPPEGSRRLPAAFSAGLPGTVQLRFNSATLPDECLLSDQHPADDSHTGLPLVLRRADQALTLVDYPYRPSRRGRAHFGAVELWCPSPWRLWQLRRRIGAPVDVPVYPDFSWLRNAPLAQSNTPPQRQGRQVKRQAGDGQEFHQLREYRPGDTMRQIDWRATARRGELISREYRDEQNRHIIMLLDGGQRLATPVGQRTLFDHALDAALLLSASALDEGDRPGLMLFSNPEPLWVPPLRNRSALHHLLHQVYPLQPGALTAVTEGQTSDYSSAATALLQRWRRQALVVLITRLQPDDCEDLLDAVRLLRGRCRIMIGDIQLPDQVALQRCDIDSADDALRVAADALYQRDRDALHGRLRHAGVVVSQGTPEALPQRLNQAYQALRRAGRL
ncbi:DUF58 domain-containing protein [Alcanivorax sp. JB21]|uniref:DUF58 domain-containing protein n=1 Tax=Alcanivorax limicola TaxID=2874102 RepID=UPI001CBF0D75|nr:DUF58 domain-containing protein [Alcanivorax limicola]MBZ2188453.1 DUF58 domain-containing protein [Alcanivorax limicola]